MKLEPLVLSALLAGLVLAPGPARAGDEPTTVRDAYQQLRDGGCQVATIGSPIVARALRNVPYALKGKIFKSAELADLYARDGGWYQPADPRAEVDAADRACVRKLDAQEKALRKRVKLKPAIEQALTRHPGAVLDMYRLVLSDFRTFKQRAQTVDGKQVWTVWFEAGGGAASVQVECTLPAADARARPPAWGQLDCHVLAAG